MRLATFDIFDTTLVRICGVPDAIFGLMAMELWPDSESSRTAFINRRRQVAAEAGVNASLTDIYSKIGETEFAPYGQEILQKTELKIESRMLIANPVIKKIISSLRAEGYIIKFLSDMYLPSDFLKKILKREGCLTDEEEVIVSCEWNARKDNGSLYQKVHETYAPTSWLHHGDNAHSDIRMARRRNVKAEKVNTGFTPIERQINALGASLRDSTMASLAAGIMRMSRLDGHNSADATLAADYVGSLYIPFVAYVLRTARRNGIQRLHFLSRDGYIMQKIAESLDHDGIDLNYLFVSRRSLIWAYMTENCEQRFIETSDRKNLLMRSVDTLLDRLQTSREELRQECSVTFNYDKILSPSCQREFLDTLFNHPRVTPWLMERIAQNARLTLDYLRQEGLADDIPQAMVDIGWLGTTRLMINSILGLDNSHGHLSIPTFYIGVRGDVYPRSHGDYYSFFPQGALDTDATALIENYYSASPYPSTIGYSAENGSIKPRFAHGQSYQESDTVRTNVSTTVRMSQFIKPFIDNMSDDLLYQWAKISIDSIATLRDNIDLRPLLNSAEFDGTPMASKLSAGQLFSITALGGRHTAFDRGSLSLTVGHKMGDRLWRLHNITSRLRKAIYNRWILKKK